MSEGIAGIITGCLIGGSLTYLATSYHYTKKVKRELNRLQGISDKLNVDFVKLLQDVLQEVQDAIARSDARERPS